MDWVRAWPIHRYLLALALLVATAGVGATLYVRESGIHDAADVVERGSHFSAGLASSEIDKAIEQLTSTTAGLAATPNLAAVLDNPQDCSLTFAGVGVFPQGHLDIIAPDGRVVCSSEELGGQEGPDYTSESWYRQAQGESTLAGPVMDRLSGKPALVQAVPSESGVVVAAFLELENLGPALSDQFGGPRHFEFLVLDHSNDRIITRSIDPSRWTGATLPGDPWPTGDSFQRNDLEGEARYYGHASVSSLGWSVYAGATRSEAIAPAEDLFRKTAWIIGLGVLLTIAALWVVWRQIARPIRSLRRAVRGASDGSVTERALVSGPSEVQELGRDFERLLQSVASELAQRVLAEEEARRSERTYRLLFEKNPEPMWIYDTDSLKFVEVNDTACEHYGYPREQWQNMTVKDIRPPEDVPALLESVASNKTVDRSGPWRHLKSNGDEIDVEITSHEIEFQGHRGRFVMAHDVTKRLQLEKQLRQSQRLESLGELAGGVAHDFNNLLAVIQNYSIFVREALEQSSAPELQVAIEDTDQITNAAKRAASLTHRLLTFARQEVTHPEVVNPNGIIDEVHKLLRRTIGEEIDFKLGLEEDIWSVRIDPSQLQQVILNLAVNARDAMPEGGTLTIETLNIDVDETYASSWSGLETGHFVRIRVSDTGVGMAPEVAEKVFEPFFTTKEMNRGTGLGLATVHGIVVQAGGAVHVYSEPGMGTAMSVLLPATDEAPSVHKRAPVRTLSGDETILVVEDEDAIREVMRRMLERHGYEVILAESGEEAIAIAQDSSRHIDVVITDVVMPGMMGREITERIAAIRPATKLIYMSGYAQAVLDSRGRLEAGRVLVEKPFTETDLLTAVRESLEQA